MGNIRKVLLWRSGFVLLLALCVSSIYFCGCAARQKNVTNLPAGVTLAEVQHWDSAVANLDKIAQTTSTARKAVMDLNQQGLVAGEYYGKILTTFGKIDQLQIDAVQFLKSQPKNWGASTQAKVNNDLSLIQAELQNLTQQQMVGIKSAGAQKQVGALITEIGDLAALILSTVG
jgi:hypothetical protein